MYDVRRYTASERKVWDEFVGRSKNGTFLFMRDYMDYHHERFADCSAIVADPSGQPVALFPANLAGDRVISHGGLSYGGMISDSSMSAARGVDVFDQWMEYCRSLGANEISYKAVPPIYHRAPSDEDLYALFCYGAVLVRRDVLSVVDLTAPLPLQSRRRRGARRAAQSGFVVRESGDLDAFWPILEANLDSRHGVKPVHTLAEIQLLRQRFPDNISLFAVFEGETMCAGSVLYCAPPTVHAQYIASTPRAREIGGLDLLFTSLLSQDRSNIRYFDFGNSNTQEGRYLNRGLAEFKEGFGARAICQDFYRLALRAP